MKISLIVICFLLAILAGYFFYQWQYNKFGVISVNAPNDAEIIIEGDFISIQTIDSYTVPLDYGRYIVRIPEYNIQCMIHKNNRGNAFINVIDVNEFDVKCDSNAWVVEDRNE